MIEFKFGDKRVKVSKVGKQLLFRFGVVNVFYCEESTENLFSKVFNCIIEYKNEFYFLNKDSGLSIYDLSGFRINTDRVLTNREDEIRISSLINVLNGQDKTELKDIELTFVIFGSKNNWNDCDNCWFDAYCQTYCGKTFCSWDTKGCL